MNKRWIMPVLAGAVVAISMAAVATAQTVGADVYTPGGRANYQYADPAFQRVWMRVDGPFQANKVSRSWFWGRGPNSIGLLEPYAEDPLDRGVHLVQYFDKNRMEINNPKGDRNSPFFVTNGLLTVEMISGQIQVGRDAYTTLNKACIPMAGDFANTLAPTYADFAAVANSRLGDHPAASRIGQKPTQTMSRGGTIANDASKANLQGTEFAYFDPKTRHNIPAVTWNFLNSSGVVFDAQGRAVTERLMNPWYFGSGLPVSEPYWAKAPIRGQVVDVLIQAFERVVFTYVPTNPVGWRVEYGNIGQHYFDWRYRGIGLCQGDTPGAPQVPVPAGAPVVLPTNTPAPVPTSAPTTVPATEPPGAPTNTPAPRATNTPVPQATNTPAPQATNTPVPVLTVTNTPTRPAPPPPPTNTFTRTPTRTFTPTNTRTFTPSNTPTVHRPPTRTDTPTKVPTTPAPRYQPFATTVPQSAP